MDFEQTIRDKGYTFQESIRKTITKSFPANDGNEIAGALEEIASILKSVNSEAGDELNIQSPEIKFEKFYTDREEKKLLNFYAVITNDPF